MTVAPYPEFFNDVFGPVMQPGSSSHTAGPCRLGYLAGCLLGEPVAKMRVELDKDGSFAGTFGIMAEDRAMVAGVLGFLPDDARLFRSFELAEEAGAEVEFSFTEITESRHPNAVKFVLTGRDGLMVTLVGDSTGGGMVETVALDGFPYRTIGDAWVLLVQDPLEALSSEDLERLRASFPHVLTAATVRSEGRGALHVFDLPAEPDLSGAEELLAAAPVHRLALLRPLLPVVSQPEASIS
jgi:L-serine dehydratase